MPSYRVERFWNELHLDDGEEVSGVDLNGSPNGQNLALVKEAPTSGTADEDLICGAVLDSGSPCQRSVSDSSETCWQH